MHDPDPMPHIGILTERMTMGFGVDLVIHEQAVRLVRRGYRVTVFPAWKTGMYDNQPYKLVPLTRDSDEPIQYFSPEFMNRSFDIMNRTPVNIWMIHTPPFYYWLTHLPAPVIMVEHGSPPGRFFKYRQGKALDAQTRKRQRRTFRSTRPGDGLIAISEYIRSELPQDVQPATTVIHNGADHYPPASRDSARDWRRTLGIRSGEIMVLWVGRIQPEKDPQPYKGLGDLLRIVPKLHAGNRKIRMVVAGKGDSSAASRLETLGIVPVFNVPRDRMPGLYAAADVFLNTSSWEGFNLPLAEAQYQGTPVVALNLCAHPEVVMNGYSGVLGDSPGELIDAVLRLAGDETLRQRMSEGARRHMDAFTWDANVDALERLMQGCLKAVRSGETPDK
nr:glycosyltransferase family 4 protein [bacterium]